MVDCLLVLGVGEGGWVELEWAGLVRAGCCEAAFCVLACASGRWGGGEARCLMPLSRSWDLGPRIYESHTDGGDAVTPDLKIGTGIIYC